MKYLLVVDMQEDYVGNYRNRKMYPYDTNVLIPNVNAKIDEYKCDNVVYVVNRFFWESKRRPKIVAEDVHVVSDYIFEKRRQDAFSNEELLEFLKEHSVTQLEIVGVDGNHCICKTALGAVNNSFEVFIDEKNIAVKDKAKFAETRKILKDAGVSVKNHADAMSFHTAI